MASSQSTTFGNIVVSAITAAAVTLSGNLGLGGNDISNVGTSEATTLSGGTIRTTAGDTIINSSGVETLDTLSGARLFSGTGFTVGNTDGLGCSQLTVLNGTAAWETITCP